MFKIAKSKLPELLKAIAAQQELFLPVNNNGQVNFAAWFEGCNADIETLKTVKSPKDMFFPQSETLYTVKKSSTSSPLSRRRLQIRTSSRSA